MQHQKLKLLVIALLVCAPIYAAVVINTSFPVNIPVLIPCAAGGAGEVVTLTGNLHVLMSVTVNANNVSFDSHVQAQGISGTGSVTGDKYQATGITRFNFNADVIGFPFNSTAPLGNNVTVSPAQVGVQGINNLALGRVSPVAGQELHYQTEPLRDPLPQRRELSRLGHQ